MGSGDRLGRLGVVRLARATAIAAALLLTAGAASALADTATLSVLTTDGQPDPAAGVPRIFTLSGTTSLPKRVYVKYRAVGGAPCAPTASSDSGSALLDDSYDTYFYGESVNGNFRLQDVDTWGAAGAVMFCIWLSTDNSSTIATPIAQTVTFRGPNGAISASVSPTTPRPQQQTTITVSGSTETPAYVYATVRTAGGAPCGPSYRSDPGSGLIDGTAVNGAFSLAVQTRNAAGSYLVCTWLAESSDDPSPIAGPQSMTFTVQAPPPPPCVVPTLGRDRRLSTVETQIRSSHCRIGRIVSAYSRRPKGSVIGLKPSSGTQLPWRAHVGIVVSKGRKHHRRHRHR